MAEIDEDLPKHVISHQEHQIQPKRPARIIKKTNVQSVEASLDGVNSHRTRAVRVKRHVLRARTSQIAMMNNAKGTTMISAQLGIKKTAIASPLVKKGKTE